MSVSTFSDAGFTESGDLPDFTSFITGIDAVVQRVQFRLQLHRGEWFADPTRGIPWKQFQSLKPVPTRLVETKIRAALISMPSIDAVQQLTVTLDSDNRELLIDLALLVGRDVVEIGFSTTPPSRHGNVSLYVLYRRLAASINNVRGV